MRVVPFAATPVIRLPISCCSVAPGTSLCTACTRYPVIGGVPGRATAGVQVTGVRRDHGDVRAGQCVGAVGVVEDVGGLEGVGRGELEARGVATLGCRGEGAGDGPDVALADDRVDQGGLDDPLLDVGLVDGRVDVPLHDDGVVRRARALHRVTGDERVLHAGVVGEAVGEGDLDDVAGEHVGGDVEARARTPARATGVVDLERDAAGRDGGLGGADRADPGPVQGQRGHLADAVAVALDGDEVAVGEGDDVVRRDRYGAGCDATEHRQRRHRGGDESGGRQRRPPAGRCPPPRGVVHGCSLSLSSRGTESRRAI